MGVGWNSDELGWIATATAIAAPLVVGAARWAAAIRLRRHRNLIADALDRMWALEAARSKPRARWRGRGNAVVEVLARQDGAALALRANDIPAPDGERDMAVLVAAEATTATVEPLRADKPDDSGWEEATVAPIVRDHPQLRDIAEQVGHCADRLIAAGRMVLGEGERFGLPEDGRGERLAAALDRARLAVRDARRLAEDGDPLAALTALTTLDIPVPEAGFPGQAVADELRTQVNRLARLALRHRTALADYRAAAEAMIHEERP